MTHDNLDTATLSILRDPEHASDALFDMLYPAAIRALSSRHWTPVDVARRAARLFQDAGVGTVLDVGAGAGKFAVVAASAAPNVHFVGMEQRGRLVDLALRAVAKLGITNVSFLLGDALDLPWDGFDGLYFFNPFAESLFDQRDRIDDRADLTRDRFFHDVLCAESELRACRVGTAVVTYHGMGGRIPACFELRHEERVRSDCLRLWVKTDATDDSSFYLEMNDGVLLCRADPRRAALGVED
jgi:SAM-dependent methyltransferase